MLYYYALSILLVVGLGVSCTTPVPAGDPACEVAVSSTRITPSNTDQVDILFMNDKSGGAASEQVRFAEALPEFFARLSAANGDLHMGFVTTDVGVNGHPIPTCESEFGDDGVLYRTSERHNCEDVIAPDAPPFLSFRSDEAGSPDLFQDASCLTNIGDDGCGVEQPFESVLKAITPSSSALRFAGDTRGHADGLNEGFLRDDSVLAIVFLTDEDDCAIQDPDLFDAQSEVYTEPNLSLRCFRYGDPSLGALHPVARFVDGLLAVRAPERLVFAAIAGVPEDLDTRAGEDTPWDALAGDESVRDPRMTFTLEDRVNQPAACELPNRVSAHAAIRIATAARDLETQGVRASVHSICTENFGPALTFIADQILDAMSGACVGPLDVDEDGVARCEVVETLREGTCSERHGRVPAGEDERGQTLCKICQGDASGALIDDDPACQALGQVGWVEREAEACPSGRTRRLDFAPLLPTSPRLLCPDPTLVCSN